MLKSTGSALDFCYRTYQMQNVQDHSPQPILNISTPANPHLPVHSSAFSFIYLHNLHNCDDFMVSLYCCLNVLFNVVNGPSIVLHLSYSIFVNDSRNCMPVLHCQFFMIALCSACGILYNLKILFTYRPNFLSLLYFSSAS